jgi:hypothetical protein
MHFRIRLACLLFLSLTALPSCVEENAPSPEPLCSDGKCDDNGREDSLEGVGCFIGDEHYRQGIEVNGQVCLPDGEWTPGALAVFCTISDPEVRYPVAMVEGQTFCGADGEWHPHESDRDACWLEGLQYPHNFRHDAGFTCKDGFWVEDSDDSTSCPALGPNDSRCFLGTEEFAVGCVVGGFTCGEDGLWS